MQAIIDAAVERLDLVNVALGRRARQSSVSPWSGPSDATGATAGDRGIAFGFHTGDEHCPWWELDLEQALPVHSLALFNREDFRECSERASRITVAVSEDGERWTPLLETHSLCFGGAVSGYPLALHLGERHMVRFVRVGLAEAAHLHLAQVEVYVARARLAEAALAARYGLKHWGPNNRVRGRIPAAETGDPRFESLTIRLYGRFGNQVLQLVHAGLVARRLGARRVHLDEVNPGALTAPVVVDGLTYDPWPRQAEAGPDFHATCYHPTELGALLEPGDPEAAAAALAVLPALLAPRIAAAATPDPRQLVVHLRSGDVFTAHSVNGDLVQPPLSFYQFAIRDARDRFGIESVQLVYENAQNPVVERLQEWLEGQPLQVTRQSGSFDEDLSALFGAVHMVGGVGTFTEAVALASPLLRSRYAMQRHYLHLLAPVLQARGVRCLIVQDDPEAPYTRIGEWRNSPEQRAAMLDYPIERLRLQTP